MIMMDSSNNPDFITIKGEQYSTKLSELALQTDNSIKDGACQAGNL
jgi:hypothetical protein